MVIPKRLGKMAADGMLRIGTPVEDHTEKYGLFIKREDLACPPPGPPFSKTRGVYARIASRPERLIGVLDTYHSQAGHAVARACQVLGKRCLNFYPEYKHDPGCREPQTRAKALGADLRGLPAGRSCILFHAARKEVESLGGYMMPNALKLDESVRETAKEVPADEYDTVIIPASSGTIAAGVIAGFYATARETMPRFIIHLGYSRSHPEVTRYLAEASGVTSSKVQIAIVDEGYQYKDVAGDGETPPWPCNEHYDLKAFRWWDSTSAVYKAQCGRVLFWNIG